MSQSTVKPISVPTALEHKALDLAKDLDEHRKQRATLFSADYCETIERLWSHPDMTGVWQDLRAWKLTDEQQIDFLKCAYSTLIEWVKSDRRPMTAQREHFQLVAQEARQLLYLLCSPDDGQTLTDVEKRDREGILRAAEYLLHETPEQSLNPTEDFTIRLNPPPGEEDHERPPDYTYPSGRGRLKGFLFMLHDVMSRAACAMEGDPMYGINFYNADLYFSRKSNGPDAWASFFVFNLSQWANRTAKRPLHDLIARTASIIFGVDVDPDKVRKARPMM